jgi:hypothetical protein
LSAPSAPYLIVSINLLNILLGRIARHKKLDFTRTGTINQAGFKFG